MFEKRAISLLRLWSGFRRGIPKFLLTAALLGVCLVLVRTPHHTPIEMFSSPLEPGNAVLIGSVHNQQYQAIANASVVARPAVGGKEIAEVLTGADGHFILPLPRNLPATGRTRFPYFP